MKKQSLFRIYDKKSHEFISEAVFISSDGEKIISPAGKKHRLENIIIQRCTGTQDVEKNDIFEGDYLLTDEGNWKGYVVFDDGHFYLTDEAWGYSMEPNWNQCKILKKTIYPNLIEE